MICHEKSEKLHISFQWCFDKFITVEDLRTDKKIAIASRYLKIDLRWWFDEKKAQDSEIKKRFFSGSSIKEDFWNGQLKIRGIYWNIFLREKIAIS